MSGANGLLTRSAALVLSAAVTGLFLLALRVPTPPSAPAGVTSSKITYLVAARAPLAQPAEPARAAVIQRSRPVRSAAKESTQISAPNPMPAEAHVPVQAEAPRPLPAASSPEGRPHEPLRIDPAVIRAANRASKSAARTMAETSGAYFGDDPRSATEVLGRGVAEAGKPDCIGPGGSLLSVFVIAYQVAADKCK